MATVTIYNWNHDFPRLARDAGFSFDTRKTKSVTNWNDIKVIDVERIIRERDFTTIDEHLIQVLDCQLEKEFDVRILDSGFVKLFRLSQLSVEYLVQCRRLLDTSVASLRGQIKEMTEEVEYLKKLLRGKEDEIRKLRNKAKKHQKAMDYMKNSDVTNMLKKILVNDGHLARSGVEELITDSFHKCVYCNKIFLNQFYLRSHLVRRHPNDETGKDIDQNSPGSSPVRESKYKAETERLLQEIKELKDRVNVTEKRLNTNEIIVDNDLVKLSGGVSKKDDDKDVEIKEDKVEMDSMEKETIAKAMFESWKKDEETKYKEHMDILKKQLDEMTKEMDKQKQLMEKEKVALEKEEMAKLKEILKKQDEEMKLLKEKLQDKENQETNVLKQKLETQDKIWQKRLAESEDAYKKRMEEIDRNMASLMSDAKMLQQQYMNRIEFLEMETKMQKKQLEEETKKHSEEQKRNVASESNILRSPQRRQSNFEPLKKIGESTETLPPYSDGSMENILRTSVRQDSNKISQITVKNTSTTDDSVLSNNPETKRPDSSRAVGKNIRNVIQKNQTESGEEEMRRIKVKKSLFQGSKDVKNPPLLKQPSQYSKLKEHSSSVQDFHDVRRETKKDTIEESVSSSEDSEKFVSRTKSSSSRSKSSSLKSLQGGDSGRGSQKEKVMKAVRGDLMLILNKRLQQMGVARNYKGMSKDVYEKNMATVQQREQLFAKKYRNYSKIKKKLLNTLEENTKELKKQRNILVNCETSKSNLSLNKMGALLSNVKNKALSKIKGITKSANESLVPKNRSAERDVVQNVRSPVKNISSQNSRDTAKVSSASILALANNLDADKNIKRSLDSDDIDLESSDETLEDYTQVKPRTIVTTAITHQPSTSIENLLNSPIRKPSPSIRSETSIISSTPTKKKDNKALNFGDISEVDYRKTVANVLTKSEENIGSMYAGATSTSEELSDYEEKPTIRKVVSEETIVNSDRAHSQKGVLKSSVSTSALSKKKVLFDLDANQIKSRSTSPSASGSIEVKAKSNWEQRANEETEDSDDDWNISNEEIKNTFANASLYKLPTEELKLSTKQSSKIAEISKAIGQQLGARNVKPPAGSVDTLFTAQVMTNSPKQLDVFGGSTTSIGSSVFESNQPAPSSKQPQDLPVPKPRGVSSKNKVDSDVELSDWSMEDYRI